MKLTDTMNDKVTEDQPKIYYIPMIVVPWETVERNARFVWYAVGILY
jgi:hypothetical protein